MMRVPKALSALCLAAALAASLAAPRAALCADYEVIDLSPRENPSWGIRNVGIGLSSVLGSWSYWYSDRQFTIETVPANSDVALYYIRSNFQKNYERVPAPVTAKIPPRVRTTAKDAVRIRVLSDGYLTKELAYDSREVPEKLLIELEPLPNALVFLGATHLAGRTTLTLRTTEEAEMRVAKSRAFEGFQIALTKTDALEGVDAAAGLIRNLSVTQLGEDTVVRVDTHGTDFEVRSKKSFDAIRKSHVYVFDLVREGARAPTRSQVRDEFDSLGHRPAACDERFAEAIREGVPSEALERAFRSSGSIADVYRREAMMSLGAQAKGRVRADGEELRTGSPIELELALQSAPRVEGYLGLLGAYARSQDDPATVMRSLAAPELGQTEFQVVWNSAESARQRCR